MKSFEELLYYWHFRLIIFEDSLDQKKQQQKKKGVRDQNIASERPLSGMAEGQDLEGDGVKMFQRP